ncbi:MAG: hypothetical protein ACT6R7_02480 [Brevundimonas aurantiaca]|jgi:hypothetical protein|uniref:hypothetical protein n=1 Tax=Brevundimonas aurantiaca TaxID=74316 RepID=UPI0040338A41
MPDLKSLQVRAAALLALHILGAVAGIAAIVFLRAYGEAIGVGGIELALIGALGLSVLRLIPSVHRAAQADREAVPYVVQAMASIFIIGAGLSFYAHGGLPSVAGFAVSLVFWKSWLVVLKGLIPLKAAHEALKRAASSPSGTVSA